MSAAGIWRKSFGMQMTVIILMAGAWRYDHGKNDVLFFGYNHPEKSFLDFLYFDRPSDTKTVD